MLDDHAAAVQEAQDASPSAAAAESAATSGSALTRLLQILDLFTLQHPRIHVDEVMASFGIGQSTAYRYLRELSDAGLVASQGKGYYSLGRRIVELERMLQLSDPLLLAGQPVLDSLQEHCANRAFLLCTPYNGRVLCVYKIGADEIVLDGQPMAIQRGRGTSFALFRGAGSQVILAHLLPHQIKSLYLAHAGEIAESGLGATWKDFRTALAAIRKQGYARTLGRMNPGMYSVAVPVLKSDGRVAGSILMLGAATEAETALALVPLLHERATLIASGLDGSEE
jgi:DNA-binding IclR family transcriptional regulator